MAKSADKYLVIVESPAKAKTIGKILGSDFQVEASVGHVRDLPNKAEQVPEQYKGLDWAKLIGPPVTLGSTEYLVVTYDGTDLRLYVNGPQDDIGTPAARMTVVFSRNTSRPLFRDQRLRRAVGLAPLLDHADDPVGLH